MKIEITYTGELTNDQKDEIAETLVKHVPEPPEGVAIEIRIWFEEGKPYLRHDKGLVDLG